MLELNYLLVELYPVCTQEAQPFMKVTIDDQQEYLCAAHAPHKRVRGFTWEHGRSRKRTLTAGRGRAIVNCSAAPSTTSSTCWTRRR